MFAGGKQKTDQVLSESCFPISDTFLIHEPFLNPPDGKDEQMVDCCDIPIRNRYDNCPKYDVELKTQMTPST